jgi:class 3 adenylate cyclase
MLGSQQILLLADQLVKNPHDVKVVLEVARTLKSLGEPSDTRSPAPPEQTDAERKDEERIVALLERLRDPATTLAALLALCRASAAERAFWKKAPEIYALMAERLLKLGDPIMAHDIANEGRVSGAPGEVRLRQLQGLALARSGANERANEVLSALFDEGHRDSETMGILARTHKQFGLKAASLGERRQHFERASRLYRLAWEKDHDPWTGVNAATLALLLREKESATSIAETVYQRCQQELNRVENAGDNWYWPLAVLGQTALILGRPEEAERWYSQAGEVGRNLFGNLALTRRDLWLLGEYLHLDTRPIEARLHIPNVVVFVGHMIDRDDRPVPRFPPRLERVVRDAIRERLAALNARIGYASAACGSDILLHEAIQALHNQGSESHVVLPYDRKLFVGDSVALTSTGDWKNRYERVLSQAAEVLTASEQRLEIGGVSYEFSNRVLHGLAATRAEQLETGLKFLTVWDGRPGDGSGGTADSVARWKALGHEVEVIDLTTLPGAPGTGMSVAKVPAEPTIGALPAEPDAESSTVMALLFADVVGFSKLKEAQIPHFVRAFLGMVDGLLPPPPRGPLKKNTWGDGLYFAFAQVRDAGLFALELCDRVATTNWAKEHLPPELTLRVGLHAGPVYHCTDPVTKQPNCIGTHVSRAARIEPITPAGQVYASMEFAALAASEGVTDFTCSYLGPTSYAKGYGTFPLYHVHRR